MQLKKEEFWARIDRGTIDPVYLLYGDEGFFIREGMERIEHAFLGSGENAFQRYRLYGDDASIQELIELASTIPFGKSKRVICYQVTGRATTADKDLVNRYVGRPARDTVLVFTQGETGMPAALLKLLKDTAVAVRFYPLFREQVPDWIRRRASHIGLQMSRPAAQLMEELVGSDLTLLANELDKMALYLQPKKRIDIKEVEKVVGSIRIFSIFELTRSLGDKRAGESIRILRQLLEAGQSPIGIVALIAAHFRKLSVLKGHISDGTPPSNLARTMGIPPMYVKEYVQQADMFGCQEIEGIVGSLLDTDLRLKGSALSHDLILESLVFSICSPASSYFRLE
ncbi:MAG: DNA polymerase III subunit delta [bacterium]